MEGLTSTGDDLREDLTREFEQHRAGLVSTTKTKTSESETKLDLHAANNIEELRKKQTQGLGDFNSRVTEAKGDLNS